MAPKQFSECKVYYSGSIRGVPSADPEFPRQLVQYMIDNGADVLSEHVAARNDQERVAIFARRSGIDLLSLSVPDRGKTARRVDLEWVRQATHVVAIVDSPSLGVGMELQYALDKPLRGLNRTPVLCLARHELLRDNRLSNMVIGVSVEESPVFYVKGYDNLGEAKETVSEFLLGRLPLRG